MRLQQILRFVVLLLCHPCAFSFLKECSPKSQHQRGSVECSVGRERIVASELMTSTTDVNLPNGTIKNEPCPPRAWMIPEGVRFGRLDRLEFLEQPATNLQDRNSVDVKTKAVGLNFADIFTVLGLYTAANLVRQPSHEEKRGSKSESLSAFVPGLEFSGTVTDDPSNTFSKGDRVLGFTRFGAYAEQIRVPPVFLVPLPDSWSFAQGAGFLVQALTAWHGLVEIGRMPDFNQRQDSLSSPFVVIVHSASGGVGLWASEIVARRGGTVLGIVGDEDKKDAFLDRIVRSNISKNSRVMIRGKETDFAERLASELLILHASSEGMNDSLDTTTLSDLAKTGRGADMVMESLGGKYFSASFDSLNDGGALVTFGSTTYSSPGRGGINPFRLIYRYLTRPRIDPGDLTARNLRLCGFNLIFLTEKSQQLRRELVECISCLGGTAVPDDITDSRGMSLDFVTPPVIGNCFDFRTECIDALETLKSGRTVGKVVLVNNDNI